MASKHLKNDEFFEKLSQLIEHTQQKGHGSVFLTQKRLSNEQPQGKPATQDSATDAFADLNLSAPLPLLIRATDGNSQTVDRKKSKDKVKLSTVVQADDVDAFFSRYAEVCRANMQSLKKRDRSKRKKGKKKDAKKTENTEPGAS